MSVVLEDNAIPLKPNLFVKAKFYPKKYPDELLLSPAEVSNSLNQCKKFLILLSR
jgi:hypothetical protein